MRTEYERGFREGDYVRNEQARIDQEIDREANAYLWLALSAVMVVISLFGSGIWITLLWLVACLIHLVRARLARREKLKIQVALNEWLSIHGDALRTTTLFVAEKIMREED